MHKIADVRRPPSFCGILAFLSILLLLGANAQSLTVYPSVELAIETTAGKFYQIQVSQDMESWENRGVPLVGDGSTKSVHFSTRGVAKEFYRVEELDTTEVVEIDLLSFFNPFGVWEYDNLEGGTNPVGDWLKRSLGTTMKNGTPVIRLQEYTDAGVENDAQYVSTNFETAVYQIGWLNHGHGEWYWDSPVPILLKRFVPGQEYVMRGLGRSDLPGFVGDGSIRMDFEQVTVPAGTFEAIKVTTTFTVNPSEPSAETFIFQEWYAENVGLVQREQETGDVWQLKRREVLTP